MTKPGWFVTCLECHRAFDLRLARDSQEWYYGHDCEVPVESVYVEPLETDGIEVTG